MIDLHKKTSIFSTKTVLNVHEAIEKQKEKSC